jgi:hypothetical protein
MEGGRRRWAARHLLDRQIADADDVATAKVDDLELELSGELPVVTAILCGQAALAGRFAPRMARLFERLRRVVDPVGEPGPARIPWSAVKDVGTDVRLTSRRDDLEVTAAETWLATHVIGRIPGGSREAE